KRYTEEVVRLGDNRAAVIESTVRMGPVMLAAGSVAALGFASLALFGVPAIANFGLACAYGIGSAVVLEMTLIPALRSLLPAPRHVPRAHPSRHRPPRRARRARGHGGRARPRRARRDAHPHLRLDARVHGAGQPAAHAPRGDREALSRHGDDDDPLRGRAGERQDGGGAPAHGGAPAGAHGRSVGLADGVARRPRQDAPPRLRPRRARALLDPRRSGAGLPAYLPRRLARLRALHRPRAGQGARDRLSPRRRLRARGPAYPPRPALARRPPSAA